MRVYLPTTRALLAEQHAAGAVVATDDVVVAEDDSEDAEYAALMTAADLSAELLAGAGDGAGRRIVVVAEVASEPSPGDSVAWRDVVAVHADVADRPADADPDDDLAWFATQEVATII